MAQICSLCYDKNAHLAEGGTGGRTTALHSASASNDGRFTPSDNKSQTNSETSNVRFKVNVLK